MDRFLEHIPKNGIIYDIGANIGNHTLFFSKYALPNKIFAFEPIKEICDVLVHNLKDNNINNVEIINAAISDKDTKGNMNIKIGNIGGSSLSYNQSGNIDVVKLDDLNMAPPQFIKLDVENFEYEALTGMEAILTEYHPILWIEIWDKSFSRVNFKLNQLGYKMTDMISTNDYGNYIYT